ncbi:MAG: hypothetical protein P8Y03_17375, partial [Anaerolineales bacterium]
MTPDHAGEPAGQAIVDQIPSRPSLGPRMLACIPSVSMPFKPQRDAYFAGENIEAKVFGLNGECLGLEGFTIREYVGSGFAGQVYRAAPVNGVLP